ncbi:MAG: type I methionyl aminopeptidase [Vicinamibacterales bacterium]
MTIRSPEELEAMRRVGSVVARVRDAMVAMVAPGVTTGDLDREAERLASAVGARSAPQLTYGFPGFTCISVNEQVVHGIPGPYAVQPGDIVKVDVTLELDGYMADSAVSVLVPPVNDDARRLQRGATEAFERGWNAAVAGARMRDVGAAVEKVADSYGLRVLKELAGHGIGRKLHEPPDVPNWGDPDNTTVLHEGLVFALEPMFSLSDHRIKEEHDGWTVRTRRRSLAIHFEHTVMVQAAGPPLILTVSD